MKNPQPTKNEIKPQHFAWNGLKTKQRESKQKHEHTTKRNVCVMYGKYVHCTHTHTDTRTCRCTYGYVLLRKGTGIHPGRVGHINISFSVCCAPFTTCYFARSPDYKNESSFYARMQQLPPISWAFDFFPMRSCGINYCSHCARWNNEREAYAKRQREVYLFVIKNIFMCVRVHISFRLNCAARALLTVNIFLTINKISGSWKS